MENNNEYENREGRNSNTEYLPTKCRITKPPPPKPATNPMQFVKVAPCPLFQKAQEQIKKVEEIKKERKEVREEPEDWQQNLDNWKSCRRKRQEHIIERVVEVKKLEQEEQERHRRKNKTFNEMIEDRTRGRHKFNIPVYDDDSNDLSDYGIGSSSSKTNSIKDVDTDDSNSILDEKDNLNASNQSQSEDETNINKTNNYKNESNNDTFINNTSSTKPNDETLIINKKSLTTGNVQQPQQKQSSSSLLLTATTSTPSSIKTESNEQYTYEGAIQDYRSRIKSKVLVDESVFTKHENILKSKEHCEAQSAIPKGEIFKRKELFENEIKTVEISNYESLTSRRLSEDFVNSQSIKQRLKSLEKCTEQSNLSKIEKSASKLRDDPKTTMNNNNNNNNNNGNQSEVPRPAKISHYLIGESESCSNLNNIGQQQQQDHFENEQNEELHGEKAHQHQQNEMNNERSSSPETELYMDNLKTFSRDLDNFFGKSSDGNINNDYSVSSNYPPSVSSTELMGTSDREDSGIHTADVSCSVSQADEPVEELTDNTIPICIEKLSIQKQQQQQQQQQQQIIDNNELNSELNLDKVQNEQSHDKEDEEMQIKDDKSDEESVKEEREEERMEETQVPLTPSRKISIDETEAKNNYNNVIYESINKTLDFSNNEPFIVDDGGFPLTPLTTMEPPKVKPPPPPPVDDLMDDLPEVEIRRINSTKRIKREIHIKRSSFLGLDEPTESQIYPDINIDKPSFLQNNNNNKIEKNFKGVLSKVESHDSGLDIDRGRLSSDTWCSSSIGESITPSPERHDSEQTNSITSEEDEITKKEREIIEMVEKEEKSRDNIVEFVKKNDTNAIIPMKRNSNSNIIDNNNLLLTTATTKTSRTTTTTTSTDPYLGSESFNKPYFPQVDLDDEQDSEVLKVEHDLRQLELEEQKRKQANLLFEESRARLHNNRSLDNIYDDQHHQDDRDDGIMWRQKLYHPHAHHSHHHTNHSGDGMNYRKSMPDLQQHVANEYRSSINNTEAPNYNSIYNNRQIVPDLDVRYRKSMPNIQNAYCKLSPNDYQHNKTVVPENTMKYHQLDHGKSLPDIPNCNNLYKTSTSSSSSSPIKRQPIMPGKPIRPPTKEQKERFLMTNPSASDALINNNNSSNSKPRQLSRHSLQNLSAIPKTRPLSNDNWIQPRSNDQNKSNLKQQQHWLIQEAELRRISEKNNLAARNNWQQQQQPPPPARTEKHLPDSVIQTLTQRTQNRVDLAAGVNANPTPSIRRSAAGGSPSKEYPKPYMGHNQTMGHALPMPYTMPMEESSQAQDRMLSVSGKKKCSNCNKELGRGAAMIIESLCLFYHMECFICCVCHVELGDGRMGTDVRVRNQKLHCHNCYSSDDGIKFSCV